ncbi:MAG: hypothetical protein F6J87_14740 [Spirulina sp. SIO3F2]|nr:hypothetical protein [Spirulina sp. SIO3F2]
MTVTLSPARENCYGVEHRRYTFMFGRISRVRPKQIKIYQRKLGVQLPRGVNALPFTVKGQELKGITYKTFSQAVAFQSNEATQTPSAALIRYLSHENCLRFFNKVAQALINVGAIPVSVNHTINRSKPIGFGGGQQYPDDYDACAVLKMRAMA